MRAAALLRRGTSAGVMVLIIALSQDYLDVRKYYPFYGFISVPIVMGEKARRRPECFLEHPSGPMPCRGRVHYHAPLPYLLLAAASPRVRLLSVSR